MGTQSVTLENGKLTKRAERRLIADARKGCEDAARQLVAFHQDRLHAFVWRVLRDSDEADDACQEAFLRAFNSLDSFSTKYRFSTWLFTIGYRVCLNRIRQRKPMTGEVDFQLLKSNEPDAAQEIAESEEAGRLKDQIWDAVDGLTAPQRSAVMLFYREQLSCEEIAHTMEIPVATVKSHLHRARLRLKDSLALLVKDWSEIQTLRDIAS